jgi:hypothetical protein
MKFLIENVLVFLNDVVERGMVDFPKNICAKLTFFFCLSYIGSKIGLPIKAFEVDF